MKKLFTCTVTAVFGFSLFAASYTNNTYQKLAKEYTVKAERALDAGEYVLAEDYAEKAKENADLSDEYIRRMLAKESAEKDIAEAKDRIGYVESIDGDKDYPDEYEAATQSLSEAESAYSDEDWEEASKDARDAIAALSGIKDKEIAETETSEASDSEIAENESDEKEETEEVAETETEGDVLPKYYIVRSWKSDKDCFWNISALPAVYNNPYLWKHLYDANKDALPDPKNPNLIEPGMKIEIPSLSGEEREGEYDPNKDYKPYEKR